MGIYRKSYKLDRRTPVATILRLLCAKARPGGVDTSQVSNHKSLQNNSSIFIIIDYII